MDKKYKLAADTDSSMQRLEEPKIKTKIKNIHNQRTSTFILGKKTLYHQENSSLRSGYEKWLDGLKNPKTLHKVRGVCIPPKGIISGNLIPFFETKKPIQHNIIYDCNNLANQRLNYISNLHNIKNIPTMCSDLKKLSQKAKFSKQISGRYSLINKCVKCRRYFNISSYYTKQN